jgi:hypothetical protein
VSLNRGKHSKPDEDFLTPLISLLFTGVFYLLRGLFLGVFYLLRKIFRR